MKTQLRLLQICLLGFCVMAGACPKGERARKMEAELEAVVNREIAVGVSRIKVEAFIDRLVIDGEKPKRHPYQKDLSQLGTGPEMPYKPEKNLPKIKGYVLADFGVVDGDSTIMHSVLLHALFFFDEQDRLVESHVRRAYKH
jgi:hypothetical protein